MKFKICFVGCGNMAIGLHGPSCKRYAELHPETELAACCDIDENKARFFKNKFGFSRYYTDMEKMLTEEQPHAVCLVSPIPVTRDLSCKIMGMGYPLIMEKPPGINSDETKEIIRMANEKNVPNRVAFNRRYMPLAEKLKELLDPKKESDGYMNINFRMLRSKRKEPDFSMTAIHGIDLVRFLAGEDYSQVLFKYQLLPHIGPGVANIHLECEFVSGALASLDFLPVCGDSAERLEICTDDSIFYFYGAEGFDRPGRLVHIEKGEKKLELNGAEFCGTDENYILLGFYNENASFFEDIRHGRKPAGDVKSALQSVEVAECIRGKLSEYRRAEYRR